jgi:hypothetical protein
MPAVEHQSLSNGITTGERGDPMGVVAAAPRTAVGRVPALGGAAVACAGVAVACGRRVLQLVSGAAIARPDELVELGVLATGVVVLAWLAASAALAATCLLVRGAGGAWRRGEAWVNRFAPAVVRRALVVTVAAGLGAASVTTASAADLVPTASPTAATVVAGGAGPDLGWVVTGGATSSLPQAAGPTGTAPGGASTRPGATLADAGSRDRGAAPRDSGPSDGPSVGVDGSASATTTPPTGSTAAPTWSTATPTTARPATPATTAPPDTVGPVGTPEPATPGTWRPAAGAATSGTWRPAASAAARQGTWRPAASGAATPGTSRPAASGAAQVGQDASTVSPAPRWRPADQSPTPPAATVVVAPGDTLWDIAARHLPVGASAADIATAWPAWYAANAATIGPDPGLILPGQVLVTPPAVTR